MESEVSSILVAAHELKAPLSTLRQLAFSLDFADEKSLPRIKDQMISVSDRALRQINDLTRISRLEDGLFEMEPVSIRAVCDEVVRGLDFLFRYNHRDLHIKYSNKTRLVIANPDLLYSIVYNFCLNAMHYSTKESRSELSLRDHRGFVRFSVRDFGPALPSDIYSALKNGWLTRPTSIAMRPGSSGLGLYIASKFSEFMNCKIGAIRHRDGTSFFVDLPVSHQTELFS